MHGMGWMRMVTVLLVALLLAGGGGGRAARAEVITYRLDAVASGKIGARRFTDQPIVLLARVDTDFAIEIAGLGFAIDAIMKFKAHKDNPTQIPIGTPIALFRISKELQLRPDTVQSPGSPAATLLPQPSGRLILRSSELGPGKLLQATDPIAVTTDLAGPLELVLVRDHVPVTLVIRSIKGNHAVLRAMN
jgi:hypothetical protein